MIYPSYHPRKGEPTYFVEKIWKGLYPEDPDEALFSHEVSWIWSVYKEIYLGLDPKHHTIRAGHRFKVGDWFSPRVWSGKPYRSKQIIIAPDIQVKKTWNFKANKHFTLNGRSYFVEHEGDHELLEKLALNDGLSKDDFMAWFHWFTRSFDGQIICWDENIEY